MKILKEISPDTWHTPWEMEQRTDELRFLKGKLQQKWVITTHTDAGGFHPLASRDDWRDVPEVG